MFTATSKHPHNHRQSRIPRYNTRIPKPQNKPSAKSKPSTSRPHHSPSRPATTTPQLPTATYNRTTAGHAKSLPIHPDQPTQSTATLQPPDTRDSEIGHDSTSPVDPKTANIQNITKLAELPNDRLSMSTQEQAARAYSRSSPMNLNWQHGAAATAGASDAHRGSRSEPVERRGAAAESCTRIDAHTTQKATAQADGDSGSKARQQRAGVDEEKQRVHNGTPAPPFRQQQHPGDVHSSTLTGCESAAASQARRGSASSLLGRLKSSNQVEATGGGCAEGRRQRREALHATSFGPDYALNGTIEFPRTVPIGRAVEPESSGSHNNNQGDTLNIEASQPGSGENNSNAPAASNTPRQRSSAAVLESRQDARTSCESNNGELESKGSSGGSSRVRYLSEKFRRAASSAEEGSNLDSVLDDSGTADLDCTWSLSSSSHTLLSEASPGRHTLGARPRKSGAGGRAFRKANTIVDVTVASLTTLPQNGTTSSANTDEPPQSPSPLPQSLTRTRSIESVSTASVVSDYTFKDRSVQDFATRRDYVWAMREDIAAWFVNVIEIPDFTAENLFTLLSTGIILCEHANRIYEAASQSDGQQQITRRSNQRQKCRPTRGIQRFNKRVNTQSSQGKFIARDNIAQFLRWCKSELGIQNFLIFETNDLFEEEPFTPGERNVVVTLIEIIRRGGWFGIEVSDFLKLESEVIQLEQEDKQKSLYENDHLVSNQLTSEETARYVENLNYTTPISDDCAFPSPLSEAKPINTTTSTNNPRTKLNSNSEISIASDTPSSVANSSCQTEDFLLTQASTHTKPAPDYQTSTPTNRKSKSIQTAPSAPRQPKPRKPLYNIDTGVQSELKKCTCPEKFELVKIANGKYRLGNTKTVLFLRILRTHILVRVGGGWDTFDNWLEKHDPCRNGRSRVKMPKELTVPAPKRSATARGSRSLTPKTATIDLSPGTAICTVHRPRSLDPSSSSYLRSSSFVKDNKQKFSVNGDPKILGTPSALQRSGATIFSKSRSEISTPGRISGASSRISSRPSSRPNSRPMSRRNSKSSSRSMDKREIEGVQVRVSEASKRLTDERHKISSRQALGATKSATLPRNLSDPLDDGLGFSSAKSMQVENFNRSQSALGNSSSGRYYRPRQDSTLGMGRRAQSKTKIPLPKFSK